MSENISTPAVQQPVEPEVEEKVEYTAAESLLAWICLIAGYVFCRTFPVTTNPLGCAIFVVALFISTAVVLVIKGFRPTALPVTVAVSAVLIAASLVINENSVIHFFAYAYALFAYLYFVYASTSSTLEKGLSNLMIADLFRAAIIFPFTSFGRIFSVLVCGKGKANKTLLKSLLGIVFAIIPTAIVFALLSYDNDFIELVDKLFHFDLDDVVSIILSIGFGIPIGMYLFGLYASAKENKCVNTLTAESCKKTAKTVRFAPLPTVFSAVLPILVIYLLFFISQWKYYVSGFIGVLPDEIAYAQYAREGFFQLCAVSAINLVILSLVAIFMQRKEDRPSWWLKIISLVYSVFTLILLSTAAAKLVLYIDRYGLTTKRVYAAWFMAVLAILFLLIIVKQFASKIKMIPISTAVVVCMFALLSFSGVDNFIADYNVDRYLNGSIDGLDVDALGDLGYASVPSLERLLNAGDNAEEYESFPSGSYHLVCIDAKLQMEEFAAKLSREIPLSELTLRSVGARSILKDMGYIEVKEQTSSFAD